MGIPKPSVAPVTTGKSQLVAYSVDVLVTVDDSQLLTHSIGVLATATLLLDW